jgi:ferric-dicitrate binding protein FerR (iron transport regulator)
MKVTKQIIDDLIPLYAANECSADTRALVEEYLQQNPREAEELRAVMKSSLPRMTLPANDLQEIRSFLEARRQLRRRSWIRSVAIFFSLVPFSFYYADGHSWWLLRDAPKSALVYFALGMGLWVFFFADRRRAQSP